MLNILISEDHEIVRVGTTLLIREMYPQAVIDEAEDFYRTLQLLEEKKYDLLMLDVNISGGNTISMIEVARQRQKNVPILIFSSYDEELFALRFIEAGANGFISKDAPIEDIRQAIKTVIEKRDYVSSRAQEQLLNLFKDRGSAKSTGLASLSDRETEIMYLLVKGAGTKEIGTMLNLQKNTISTYKARIFKKLKVDNVVELAAKVGSL